MFNTKYLKFLCCPVCGGNITSVASTWLLCEGCRKKFAIRQGIPILLKEKIRTDDISYTKWDRNYKTWVSKEANNLKKIKEEFNNKFLADTIRQLLRFSPHIKGKAYIEIGCGPFFVGTRLSKYGAFVIGVDFSFAALRMAKFFLDEAGVKDYLLVLGNITNIPIRSNTCDLLYGGGVVEHVVDTQRVLHESYRILKKNGVSYNTVPLLNIGSLTYRQVWGNIPNLFVLKQLAEFIHITLLKKRHMRFGYELSFLPGTLRRMHELSGFRTIQIDKFEVWLEFEYIPAMLRKPLKFLATKSPLFWPMIYVAAKK